MDDAKAEALKLRLEARRLDLQEAGNEQSQESGASIGLLIGVLGELIDQMEEMIEQHRA